MEATGDTQEPFHRQFVDAGFQIFVQLAPARRLRTSVTSSASA